MKRTESTSAPVLQKTQPEEFDLGILGGGTGSTVGAWVAPKHRVPAEQEHHSQRESRIALSPKAANSTSHTGFRSLAKS